MPITMKTVLAYLTADEPDYSKAAELGSEAIPHLEKLADGSDRLLASKAVYLAGLIDEEGSVRIVKKAANSAVPEIRLAAASTSRHLKRFPVPEVLAQLKDDPDPGVRKYALVAAGKWS